MWELYKNGGNSFEGLDAYTKSLLEMLKKHDYFSWWHCCHVACMVGKIALEQAPALEVSYAELIQGAVLHDIGKLHISRSILEKKGVLSREEHYEINQHPQMGELIVRGHVSSGVGRMVLYHHERCGGTGYPFGLEMTSLPLDVRIVSVCDCYCAMTERRPYGKTYSPREAVLEMRKSSLCPQAVALVEKVVPGNFI